MIKVISLVFLTLSFYCGSLNANNRSNPQRTLHYNDVNISFHQRKNNNAWTVEWRVKNNSAEKIEPILISRNYHCIDNNMQHIGLSTLGTFLPGANDKTHLKDHGVCPNSKIKLVEIETEIHLDTKNHDFISKDSL